MQTESKEAHSTDEAKIGEENPSELERNQSNNHHVVPIGVLVVLCTMYLMITGLQINYNQYFKPGVAALKISKPNVDFPNENLLLQADSKDLGVQQQPLCRITEVFTQEAFTRKEANDSKEHPVTPKNLSIRHNQLRSTKPTKSGIRQSKAGKSTEANRKKDIARKSNTAEPIIYLFALVFIYLLLKAASDINQHYKTNKGDKRLRRCSLQSYAQKEQRIAHQDRRASKDALSQSRHYILTEGRSVSLDRYRHRDENAIAPKDLATIMPKQTSIGDYPRYYPIKPSPLVTGQLLEPRTCRRLSVPISINYQPVHVSPVVHPEMVRRGSVINIGSVVDMTALPLATPSALQAAQTPDFKRRVRMINRH